VVVSFSSGLKRRRQDRRNTHSTITHTNDVRELVFLHGGGGLGRQGAGKRREKKSFHTHSNGRERGRLACGSNRKRKGTYNLILGELLDEQKDHVRGAVVCVAVGVRECVCADGAGQVHELT